MPDASNQTAYKMFDIGDDLGTIARYILDYRESNDFKENDW